LTTDELKRLWVEVCKSWASAPDIEPLEVADVEAELDLRKEGLPFHLAREELAILASHRVACIDPLHQDEPGETDNGSSSLPTYRPASTAEPQHRHADIAVKSGLESALF
jgi:hypothetical protein